MTTPVLFLDDVAASVEGVDRASATQLAQGLIGTLSALRDKNKRFSLNSTVPIPEYEIAKGWSLVTILGGKSFKEEWSFIKRLNDRSPLDADMDDNAVLHVKGSECLTQRSSISSSTLNWALLLETSTVSAGTHLDWRTEWIDVNLCSLLDDGSIDTQPERIRNTSESAHVALHAEWIEKLGLDEMVPAIEIWDQRVERYPNLRFLERTKKDLIALQAMGARMQELCKL